MEALAYFRTGRKGAILDAEAGGQHAHKTDDGAVKGSTPARTWEVESAPV